MAELTQLDEDEKDLILSMLLERKVRLRNLTERVEKDQRLSSGTRHSKLIRLRKAAEVTEGLQRKLSLGKYEEAA